MVTTLLTDYGNAKILDAIAQETTVAITAIAYGDGNGSQYTPTTDQTSLRHQLGTITSIEKEFDQADGFIYFKGIIPANIDDFTLRELGLLDDEGNLISITVIPDVEKPLASDGVSIALPISLGFKTSIGEVMIIVEDGSDTYANVNLSNLTTAGETHFDTTYAKTNLSNLTLEGERHFLGRTHITNCITETPQRIFYTLSNGTLTIEAGSTIVIPYGTDDRSSTYTPNSVFLNPNFVVESTQYIDGKFFIWATLQSNISATYTSGNFGLSVFIKPVDNTIVIYDRHTDLSGLAASPGGQTATYYDVFNNYILRYSAGSVVSGTLSLPVCRITTSSNQIATVDEIFNGITHMGSTIILDKDVRMLIPNGRNTSGSLDNIAYITPKLTVNSITSTENNSYAFFYDYTNSTIKSINESNVFSSTPDDSLTTERVYYDFATNMFTQYAKNTRSHTNYKYCQLGTYYIDSNYLHSVLDFKEKYAFRAFDYNDIDSLNKQIQSVRNIGDPIMTLSNTKEDDEVWLEGQAVSRTLYSNLWNLWGTFYGSGDGSTTFNLPDFRGKAIWGANDFGYIDAGLPNIEGTWKVDGTDCSSTGTGAFSGPKISQKGPGNYHHSDQSGAIQGFTFDASISSNIYGKSATVQPPAIKVRVKTRYK